ncbi:unnamed protein product [Schistosoma mattheei]|uniref:Uncharacterized protein n=1 Tax=Schistosoma mattheei TaxID=31246 RepID=A0A183PUI1_9TREM|nr:unnamed protein product [Schistosoma mattheei]
MHKYSTQQRHEASPHLESSRPREKREIKEYITPRNIDRHEKNKQQLDRIGKEGPGQSGLENAGWLSMLQWEKQA